MPLDSNGIWTYTETDPASLFSDTLNLLSASVSDAIEEDRDRLADLEAAPAAAALTLNSALWKAYHADWDPPRVRRQGREVWLEGMIGPNVSSISVAAGTAYPILSSPLPAGYRPAKNKMYSSIMGGTGLNQAGVRLDVLATGVVTFTPFAGFSGATQLYVSLEGARWTL